MGHLKDWRDEAERAIGMALSPHTSKAYARAGHQFNSFRWQAGFRESWPIPVPQLMKFCVYLRGKGLPVGSIRGKLVVLAFASWGRRRDR